MKRKRRPGLSAPEPLDTVLEKAGEDRFAPFRPPIPERVWRAAVGARVAERSKPIALERGVLVVRVATSVWANELSLLAEPILARLRVQHIAVSELRFRVGPIEPPARPPQRRVSRAVPAPAALPDELGRLLRTVEDAELRETIALAARANLAWQDHVAEPPEPEHPRTRAVISAAPRDAPDPRSAGRESDRRGRK